MPNTASAIVSWSSDGSFPIQSVAGYIPAGGSAPYDVIISLSGPMDFAATTYLVLMFVRTVTFVADLVGSRGKVLNNPTSTTTYTLLKNGVSFGTIAISSSGVFTFSTSGLPVTFSAGDFMTIQTPTANPTLTDFEATLAGVR